MLSEKEDIEVLMKAAAFAKIPAGQLKPLNPYTQDSPRGKLIQAAVETIDPVTAARWRTASGSQMSLETVAAEMGLQPHTKETREDLLKHDPKAVIQQRAAQEQWEKDQLAAMDKAVDELQTRRYGKPLDPKEQNFGTGWQAQSLKRQYELDKAMGGWN